MTRTSVLVGTGGCRRSFLGSRRDGHRAGAGHVDFAVAAHHVHEFVELFGIAGGFDGEAFGGGIDHAGAEDFGFLQHGGAAFPAAVRTRTSTSSRMTDGRFGQVGGLQHVDQLVHLLDHLLAQSRLPRRPRWSCGKASGSSVRATVRLSML